MVVVLYVVYALFFLMELCALAAFSYWGFTIGRGGFMKFLLGIGTPLLIAVFWGTFIAPKATFPVSVIVRIVLQSIIFGLAVFALYQVNKTTLAISLGIIVLIEMILMYSLEESLSISNS